MRNAAWALLLGLLWGCSRAPVPVPKPVTGTTGAAVAPATAPVVPPAASEAARPAAPETPLAVPPKIPVLDPSLPGYRYSGDPLTGTLVSIGSDSMEPLMLLWRDDFAVHHPGVRFNFVCKGSATAPPALLSGQALMGQMSRAMTPEEVNQFQAKFGYPPTRIVVAADALTVYVNANNPIQQLAMPEVDAIFSASRLAGHAPIDSWGDLGLQGVWQTRPIQTYGRDENSGTRAFFQERVMEKGNFKPSTKAITDQFELVEAVAIDASGICYGPFQHNIRMVKPVPLSNLKGETPVPATVQTVLNGRYPLTRFLNIYVNHKPGTPLDPLVREFVTYILSGEGQKAVADFGAVPLPADLAAMNRNRLR